MWISRLCATAAAGCRLQAVSVGASTVVTSERRLTRMSGGDNSHFDLDGGIRYGWDKIRKIVHPGRRVRLPGRILV